MGKEFYYVDHNGKKQDLEMHADIIQEDDLLEEAARMRAEREAHKASKNMNYDEMMPSKLLEAYHIHFGKMPVTVIGLTDDNITPLVEPLRQALKTGTPITEDEAANIEDEIYKDIPNGADY